MKPEKLLTILAVFLVSGTSVCFAQQSGADKGMVFTAEEVAEPEEGMVFTEDEIADGDPTGAPEIEGPDTVPDDICENLMLQKKAVGFYDTITVGPAFISYSGPDGSDAYDDSQTYSGNGRLTYDLTLDAYILTAETEPLGDIIVRFDEFGKVKSGNPAWADFYKDFRPAISREDIELATGCQDLPELAGYGTGTGGMRRHNGFPVKLRMKLTYIPLSGGQLYGMMEAKGHTTDGYDVTYKIQISLEDRR